ncbi:MAG: hypothetical protein H7X91_11305 [Burkholderiales bacterium]|nr:hypothetical protein [Burkholderiales bacterium]
MNLASLIREIGRGAHGSRDLEQDDAYALYHAMLDGEVPDLELDVILIALRMKTESLSELLRRGLVIPIATGCLQGPE